MNFISHGPVQINVERNLNIYGGGACNSDIPDDCVLPRSSGNRSRSILLKVAAASVALVIGVASVLRVAELAALALAWLLSVVAALTASTIAWITSTVTLIASMSAVVCTWIVWIVLGGWMVGRAAELYLLIERALGGGPWRLILFSKLFGWRRQRVMEVQLCPQPEPLRCTSSTLQLAAGESRGLATIDARDELLRSSAKSQPRQLSSRRET